MMDVLVIICIVVILFESLALWLQDRRTARLKAENADLRQKLDAVQGALE